MSEVLTTLNGSCQKFTFDANRVAWVPILGRHFWLISGNVGSLAVSKTGPSWRSNYCLFTVADSEEAKWMKDQPDLPMSYFSRFVIKVCASLTLNFRKTSLESTKLENKLALIE